MEIVRKAFCDKCRKNVPANTVRYVPISKDKLMVVCQACRGVTEDKKTETIVKVPSQKEEYFCNKCQYYFKHDPKGTANLKCPYCGKSDNLKKRKDLSANKIVKEADEFL